MFIKILVDMNMTLADVLAIPENDTFVYLDSQGNSLDEVYSSSTFIAALYKAAGMFGDL